MFSHSPFGLELRNELEFAVEAKLEGSETVVRESSELFTLTQ